ncbi:restriction endonuclease [Aminobacterium mobile]|uniref:restriction endonuclease n=1 Tax=Aminobacterium mobile TaxID=81467 RepID=UPI00046360D3|nr:restriction endonuclease [Aminobacterium mobile]
MSQFVKLPRKYDQVVNVDDQFSVTRLFDSRCDYCYKLSHDGLNKIKLIKSNDPYDLEIKLGNLTNQWMDQWEKLQEREEKRKNRENEKQLKEEKQRIAVEKSEEASKRLNEIQALLVSGVENTTVVDWEKAKKTENYHLPKPAPPKKPSFPIEPKRTDLKYNPKIGFFGSIFGGKKAKEEEASQNFIKDVNEWKGKVNELRTKHEEKTATYQIQIQQWEKGRDEFVQEVRAFNLYLDGMQEKYRVVTKDGVEFQAKLVLEDSSYPESFPKNFDIEYTPDNKVLVIDYQLPSPEDLPRLKEVKYIASRDEYQEKFITDSASKKLYDDAIYQVCLRTIYELFKNDQIDALCAVAFNGIVESIDPATGQDIRACILSVLVEKEEFSDINLTKINPKQCFKKLKGVGSSALHSLTPIAPVIELNRKDSRFIDAYGVVEGVSPDTNLALMNWQDFEHLIREVFEKEFSGNGGEVKVTQGSRDGGVDAIAFDPDPIRGGKIIIQAKRYTNTVGVSAVRDLYGTVMNEGATKGILISTSDYGPDAYEFAQGKPITLLNGSNLLHLLEKHGHQARINLKEAKQILSMEQ